MVESKIDRVQALSDMKFSDVMAAAFEEDIAKILTEIYTLLVSDDMKVEKKNLKKPKWSVWKIAYYYYVDPFSKSKKDLKFEYRHNGKRVQVRSGALSAMASCNEEEGDKFDLGFGLRLAAKRLVVKKIASEVESKAK